MFTDKRPELELHFRQVVHVCPQLATSYYHMMVIITWRHGHVCPQLATSYYHMMVIITWRHGQSIVFALQGSAGTSGPHCQLGLVPEYCQNLNPKVSQSLLSVHYCPNKILIPYTYKAGCIGCSLML